MDNTSNKKNISLKRGLAIKVFSIISLVCTALNCFLHLYFYYDAYEPKFMVFIILLLLIAPAVLFVLHILIFYTKLKSSILIPFIFALLAFETFYDFSTGIPYMSPVLSLIGNFACPVACFLALIIALVSVIKGFNRKKVIIIAMFLCLLYKGLSLFDILIHNWRDVYLFMSLMSIMGLSALYIAMYLFASKNIIPSVLTHSSEKEKARIKKMRPEQALKLLKDKLDLGMITEEEYQSQRAEIIAKL